MSGEFSPVRLADLNVADRQFRPEYGSIPNYEALMLGARGNTGVVNGTGFASLAAFVTTQTVFPLGRIKSILLIPSGGLTFPSGNVTARLAGARTPKAGFTSAGSNVIPANYPDGGFLGPLVTLATTVTSLPNQGIWITASDANGAAPGIPDLQYDTAHVSLEINFVGGAPTAGSLAVVMFVSPN